MKNLQVRVYTDIVTEPVSVAEAKNFCKVTGTGDDSLFPILITAARQAIEKYISGSLASKKLHATWVEMPDDHILELPYGPVISVDSVYWIDEEGTEEQATLNDDFWVYGDQDAIVKMTTYWTTGLKRTSSVRVEYTAGYGHANTETLPAALKLAVLKQIATDYDLRENIAAGGFSALDNEAKRLAAPYRKKVWF
jgi:uncharacterized phiE125 gp8 family phage protein